MFWSWCEVLKRVEKKGGHDFEQRDIAWIFHDERTRMLFHWNAQNEGTQEKHRQVWDFEQFWIETKNENIPMKFQPIKNSN